LLITSFICIAAQAAASEVDPSRQNELLYLLKHDCGSCHGMTLKGGLGPSLLPAALSDKPAGLLVNTILDGRANTAMPPWKSMLTQDEAEWLTAQLLQGVK
jgi:cytochrome c55X